MRLVTKQSIKKALKKVQSNHFLQNTISKRKKFRELFNFSDPKCFNSKFHAFNRPHDKRHEAVDNKISFAFLNTICQSLV